MAENDVSMNQFHEIDENGNYIVTNPFSGESCSLTQ